MVYILEELFLNRKYIFNIKLMKFYYINNNRIPKNNMQRKYYIKVEKCVLLEDILNQGNDNVVLCDRWVRKFKTYTRKTFDVSAIPAIKRLSHLSVIGYSSHASGKFLMALPLTLAAISAGADGIIIEVHNDQKYALCDGAQSIKPDVFDDIMQSVNMI